VLAVYTTRKFVAKLGLEPKLDTFKGCRATLHYFAIFDALFGIEPKSTDSKSVAINRYAIRQFVVLFGIEPKIRGPKTLVLPLHYKTLNKKPCSVRLSRV
jgi:hypothetical protein